MAIVEGYGPKEACICLVGEAPGADEVMEGRPFIGQSGRLLTDILESCYLDRNRDCYITNVVKEKPHHNDISHFIKFDKGKLIKKTPEYDAWEAELHEELRGIKANVLVPMGNIALYALTRMTGISVRRGSVYTSIDAIGRKKVIPTFHPASALPQRSPINKYIIKHDFLKIYNESKFPEVRLTERHINIDPTHDEIINYILACHSIPRVGFDIESSMYKRATKEMIMFSLAKSPTDAMTISLVNQDGSPMWSTTQEDDILYELSKLLDGPTEKAGQNLIYDSSILYHRYGMQVNNIQDTMVAHNIIAPDLKKDLGFLTSFYTTQPYYKDEGAKFFVAKKKLISMDAEKNYEYLYGEKPSAEALLEFVNGQADKAQLEWQGFKRYSALDSAVVLEILPQLLSDLDRLKNRKFYDIAIKCIHPILYMQERGWLVDQEALKDLSKSVTKELKQLQIDLDAQYIEVMEKQQGWRDKCSECLARIDAAKAKGKTHKGWTEKLNKLLTLNVKSPQQLKEFLYGKDCLNIKPIKVKGKISTDKKAIKKLVSNGVASAVLIQKMIQLRDDRSKYYNVKLDPDGRLRGSYNPGGTKQGRWSSRKHWFGKGCLLPEAEVLTPNGWVRLDRFEEGQALCWDKKVLSWQFCTQHMERYDSTMIEYNSWFHKQAYTRDHIIPVMSHRLVAVTDTRADETLGIDTNWYLPISGDLIEGEILEEGLPQLIAMLQADGSLEGGGARWFFTKARKMERFIELCKRYGWQYTASSHQDGVRFRIGGDVIKKVSSLIGKEKLFGDWLLTWGHKERQLFLEETKHWDGHIRGRSWIYYTARETNAKWVQTIAHTCGYSASVSVCENRQVGSYGEYTAQPLWAVKIKPRWYAIQEQKQEKKLIPYNGFVYCLNTPTGYFLTRYKDCITITHNCNQQNEPTRFKKHKLADEGCILVDVDLAQAENRIVAYLANDIAMIRAFENNEDVHSLTAGKMFGMDPTHIKELDTLLNDAKKKGLSFKEFASPLSTGEYSYRFWGKKCNHALNYMMGYMLLSSELEILPKESKFLHTAYHRAYPNVSAVFWEYLKKELYARKRVTNLLGRTRLFMGLINDDLLKEACSFIPQSSVADIMNEYGILHVWNNPNYDNWHVCNQVHDAMYLQYNMLEGNVEHMASTLRSIVHNLEVPLTFHGRTFIIPADAKAGYNCLPTFDLPVASEGTKLEEAIQKIWESQGEGKKRLASKVYAVRGPNGTPKLIQKVDRDFCHSLSSTP